MDLYDLSFYIRGCILYAFIILVLILFFWTILNIIKNKKQQTTNLQIPNNNNNTQIEDIPLRTYLVVIDFYSMEKLFLGICEFVNTIIIPSDQYYYISQIIHKKPSQLYIVPYNNYYLETEIDEISYRFEFYIKGNKSTIVDSIIVACKARKEFLELINKKFKNYLSDEQFNSLTNSQF